MADPTALPPPARRRAAGPGVHPPSAGRASAGPARRGLGRGLFRPQSECGGPCAERRSATRIRTPSLPVDGRAHAGPAEPRSAAANPSPYTVAAAAPHVRGGGRPSAAAATSAKWGVHINAKYDQYDYNRPSQHFLHFLHIILHYDEYDNKLCKKNITNMIKKYAKNSAGSILVISCIRQYAKYVIYVTSLTR